MKREGGKMRRRDVKKGRKRTRREGRSGEVKAGAGGRAREGRGREETRTNCESFLTRYFQKLYASLE